MKTGLPIYYEGRLVGELARNNAGLYELTYHETWVQDGFDISVTLPRAQRRHTGDTVRAFFENMLPEHTVRATLARSLNVGVDNILGMLSRIGRDCAGAFSLGGPHRAGEYRAISPTKLRDLLKSLPANPMATQQRSTSLSLAGAQDKLPLLLTDTTFHLPLNGAASNCIVKPPMQAFPHSVENEFFCMRLAQLAGLPTAPVHIHHLPGMVALVVGRYDREGSGFHPRRLPQEDFCQLSGIVSGLKYESDGGPSLADCAALISAHSMQKGRDLLPLAQWTAFNLCIGNNDAHAKNISMLRRGAKLTLAPFYDLLSTTFYGRMLQKKLAMKIGGQMWSHHVSRRRWEKFATDITLPPAAVFKAVESMGHAVLAALPLAEQHAGEAGISYSVASRLREHIQYRTEKVLEHSNRE